MMADRVSGKLSSRVGDIACDLLEQLILAEREVPEALKRTFALGHDNLWSCDFFLLHDVADETASDPLGFLVDDARELLGVSWPVDQACVTDKGDHWQFSRVATALPRDLRGMLRIVPGHCVTVTTGWMPKSGDGSDRNGTRSWHAETIICGLVGGRWRWIETGTLHTRTSGLDGATHVIRRAVDCPADIHNTITIALAAALTRRYSWHAAFGFAEDGPRIVLPTSPRGCIELFKQRWLAPGANRRSALRHWVEQHYRDQRNEDHEVAYVRQHLRGHTRFLWDGLDCELMVSAFDLEKNDHLAEQAAEWRALRKHNRVRLRSGVQVTRCEEAAPTVPAGQGPDASRR